MKIRYLNKHNRWEVDFGRQIPRVKDHRINKHKWVGRTTRFKSLEEAKDWTKQVLVNNRNQDTCLSGRERIDYILATKLLGDAGINESLYDVVKSWIDAQK
jgi:hypothetical protein